MRALDFRHVALTALLLAVGGCPCQKKVEAPPPPPVHDVCLEGSPRLNWYENRSHTVFVRIFQLSSLDAFAQADPGRLLDLQTPLLGSEGPPIDRTIYPDSKTSIRITQQPAAQYIGLVAAYYRLDGSGKTYVSMSALDGGPCVRLGANAIEPMPVGPQSPQK
jgi:type VI secretion system VasD/TssJ family lipoprotein